MCLTGRGLFIFKHNNTELIQLLLLTNYSFEKATDAGPIIEARHHKGYFSHELHFRSQEKCDMWSSAISKTVEAQRNGPWVEEANAREMMLMQDVTSLKGVLGLVDISVVPALTESEVEDAPSKSAEPTTPMPAVVPVPVVVPIPGETSTTVVEGAPSEVAEGADVPADVSEEAVLVAPGAAGGTAIDEPVDAAEKEQEDGDSELVADEAIAEAATEDAKDISFTSDVDAEEMMDAEEPSEVISEEMLDAEEAIIAEDVDDAEKSVEDVDAEAIPGEVESAPFIPDSCLVFGDTPPEDVASEEKSQHPSPAPPIPGVFGTISIPPQAEETRVVEVPEEAPAGVEQTDLGWVPGSELFPKEREVLHDADVLEFPAAISIPNEAEETPVPTSVVEPEVPEEDEPVEEEMPEPSEADSLPAPVEPEMTLAPEESEEPEEPPVESPVESPKGVVDVDNSRLASFVFDQALRLGVLVPATQSEFRNAMSRGEKPPEPSAVEIGSYVGGAVGTLVGRSMGRAVGEVVEATFSFIFQATIGTAVTAASILHMVASSSEFLEQRLKWLSTIV